MGEGAAASVSVVLEECGVDAELEAEGEAEGKAVASAVEADEVEGGDAEDVVSLTPCRRANGSAIACFAKPRALLKTCMIISSPVGQLIRIRGNVNVHMGNESLEVFQIV